MLGLGIVLDDSRGSTAEQRVCERAIGLGARDVVDARLADVHRTADGGGKLERVAALIGLHRVIDRWIGSGASLNAPVLRGAQQHETPAEAKAENTERRTVALQMTEPTAFDVIGYVVVELARPGQRLLVARRQRLAGIKIAHRRRQPGSRQGIRI